MTSPAQPRPAATVILLREGVNSLETFMVKRHGGHAFMANTHVFVGGRVDDADCNLAMWNDRLPTNFERAVDTRMTLDRRAAQGIYLAAIRETFEEAGVLIAEDRDGDGVRSTEVLAQWRNRLVEGQNSFLEVVNALDVTLSPARLHYVAHWITPEIEPRRYDTRFFLCVCPPDQLATSDFQESTEGNWYRLEDLLAAYYAGDMVLAPPTIAVLQDLSPFRRADEALYWAGHCDIVTILPKAHHAADGSLWLLFPGDDRYEGKCASPSKMDAFLLQEKKWIRQRR